MMKTPSKLITSSIKLTAIASAFSLVGGAVAPSSAEASPLIEFDRASIYFNGSATVRADDHVFLDEREKESDVIFIFSPGVELVVGDVGMWRLSAYYREDFLRYTDNSELNINNSNVFLTAEQSLPRLDLAFNGSFEQLAHNTFDILGGEGNIVEREIINLGVEGEYDLTHLTDLGAGINYESINFRTGGNLSDRDIITVPLDLYYNWTERVDLSLGYRFRDNNTKGAGFDSHDHFINVGARGEITPLVSGQVRVGWQQRNFDSSDLDSRDEFSFGGSATWDATPATNVTVDTHRDFRISAVGASTIVSTGIGARVDHSFTDLISANIGVGYEDARYRERDRHDQIFTANIGATYSPNEYVGLSAGYNYYMNDSDFAPADLDRNIFELSASLRY